VETLIVTPSGPAVVPLPEDDSFVRSELREPPGARHGAPSRRVDRVLEQDPGGLWLWSEVEALARCG